MFILGVGAAKSGTTWLYRYLRDLPGFANVALNGKKETHFWDRYSSPRPLRRRIVRSLEGARGLRIARPRDYFRRIKRLQESGATLIADITPGYATLDRQTFESIRAGLEKVGTEYRVVFLMRDPVNRLISKVRQDRFRGLLSQYHGADSVEEMISVGLASGIFESQVRYSKTVPILETVFPEEKLWLCPYEDLFTKDRIRELSSFLTVPERQELSSSIIGSSGPSTPIEERVKRELAVWLHDDYQFVRHRFPEVEELWPNISYA